MNNRILAIDPHPITLKGYDSMLSDEPDLSLSKAVTTGAEGLAYVREHDVELALTELRFREGGGFELVKQLDTAAPNLDVLIVSCCEATAFGSRTLQAGAQGYLQKDEATETLLEAIRTVLAGGVYLNSSLQEMTVRRYAEGSSGRALDPLTDRELEVFNAIGAGASTREIGEYLHISMKTVQTHRANIMEKLGFESKEKIRRGNRAFGDDMAAYGQDERDRILRQRSSRTSPASVDNCAHVSYAREPSSTAPLAQHSMCLTGRSTCVCP